MKVPGTRRAGTLFLNEPFTPRILARAALVVIGVAMAVRPKRTP